MNRITNVKAILIQLTRDEVEKPDNQYINGKGLFADYIIYNDIGHLACISYYYNSERKRYRFYKVVE